MTFPPRDSRHVRRLRVRATTRDDATGASVLVEDGLRTATLPFAEQGRVLLIRRLALGPISQRASAQTVALQMERAVRELASSAVAFDSPGADGADAVVVPGLVEALVHLARLRARGVRPSAWFWSKLGPAWPSVSSGEESWVGLLEAAHALPASSVAAAAVVNEVVALGKAGEMLSTISVESARQWLRASGFENHRIEPPAAENAVGIPRLGHRIDGAVDDLRRHFPLDDRLVWLVTLLAVNERPSRAGNPRLPEAIRYRLEKLISPEKEFSPGLADRDSSIANGKPSQAAAIPPVTGQRTNEEKASSRLSNARVTDESLTKAAGQEEPSGFQVRRDAFAAPVSPHGQDGWSDGGSAEPAIARPSREAVESRGDRGVQAAREIGKNERSLPAPVTCWAGLLFLVPVIQRLGMGGWLRDHPWLVEAGFPARLLQFIGRRAGLMRDDPLCLALQELSGPEPLPPLPAWPEPVHALLAVPPPRGRLDSPFEVWLTAVRRWCRRNPRMGLISLIRRPGRLLVSRTHLEICFHLSQIDPRIRRLALDVDPGWVSWLGRVIRFHYLDSDEQHG